MKKRTRKSSTRKRPQRSASTRAKKPRSLTIRQRGYLSNKLQGKSSASAARAAGYAPSYARHPERIDGSVRAAFDAILLDAGITDELLAQRVFQGLNATIVVQETRYAKREVVVDFRERREMLELVLRVLGLLTHRYEIDTGPTLAELLEESFQGDEK